jgi:hypothetical protein
MMTKEKRLELVRNLQLPNAMIGHYGVNEPHQAIFRLRSEYERRLFVEFANPYIKWRVATEEELRSIYSN